MPGIEHKLMQTILSLSALDDPVQITGSYITALNSIITSASFSIVQYRPPALESIEISTGHSSFGFLVFNPGSISGTDLEILTDSTRLFAIILENASRGKLIAELQAARTGEEHLSLVEERFLKMAGVSPAVISEYIIHPDHSTEYVYLSPAAENVFGFKPEQIIGSAELVRERVDPADRDKLRLILISSIRNLSIASYEVRYNHPVKGVVWLQTHSGFSAASDGSIHAYDFTIDITDYKNAASLLQESEERYRGIFENASIGIYLATIDHRLTNVNPALALMHGFSSPEEMISHVKQGTTMAVNPADTVKFFSQVVENGEFSGFEIEMYKKDGSKIWVNLNARVIRDTNGSPVYFEGSVEDITEKRDAMLALKRRDALFEKLTSCVPGMLYQFNRRPDGSYHMPYCSSAIMTLYNRGPEDVSESVDLLLTTVLPEDYKPLISSIEQSASNLSPWIKEFRVAVPGSTVKWIMGKAIPERLDDGTITWFGFHTDVTAIKNTEEALRSSDEQMRSILENVEEIIHIIDNDGNFLYISPSWKNSTGFSVAETTGRNFVDYIHPDDAPDCIELLNNVLKTGHPSKIMEFRVKHASGKWIWFMNNGVAIKDHDGKPVNFLGVAVDITDRKQAEKDILRERDFSRAVIDSLPGLFYLIDNRGSFIKWNKNLREFTGRSDDQLARASIIELTPEPRLAEAQQAIAQVMTNGHAEVEAEIIAPDGSIVPFWTSGTLFYNDDEPFIIGISQDISDRKRLEQQLLQSQKMEAVGQLAGGLAHDFNNLLQAILGYVELVMTKMDHSDRNYARLCEVKRAGDRATVLTSQLLAFSRRQVLQLSLIDINRVIEELIQMLDRLIGEHIELVFKPCSGSAVARADKGQIEQAITNLCVNARDAMPDGGTLTIETSGFYADNDYVSGHQWASPGNYVCISVTDTGTGIDREVIEKIFEPFFTTKERDRGTGLGLAMVYGIIRQHQGMVQVYSEPAHGSCFRIYLPSENGQPVDEQVEQRSTPPGGTETILLAEDDAQIRELACTILQDAGYHVHVASDGLEALDLYREHNSEIDLLFVDVIMPKLSGRAVYDQARIINPAIKCIFASGYNRDGLHRNYILDNDIHLLQKPYSGNALLNLVRNVIDGK